MTHPSPPLVQPTADAPGAPARVHAWQPAGYIGDEQRRDTEPRVLAESLEGRPSRYPGIPIEHRTVPGPPAAALLDAASDAQLLVVGARGRGGFTGLLLGSTSHAVLHHAPCPIAVVRAQHVV
ncbi:universal stress protein [Micromonospora sp. NPDC048830]|uniref:universal stress protein n=1 Tax=Micromonospora sp. NPDC048830 TaxID=3364257 RepID=UPI0037159E20